ncbi:glycine oxidase ThiO [soil metagenome]
MPPARYDRMVNVGIIGAGIIGCAIARALARRGAAVTVFEERGIGAGATQASAGVLAPYVEAHEPGPLQALTVRSLGLYDAFVRGVGEESGDAIDYARRGSLEVALRPEEADRLEELVSRSPGGALSWLDAEAACDMEPGLTRSILGGALARSHGYVSAPQLTGALAASARAAGAVFVPARVSAVHPRGPGVSVTLDGRVSREYDRIVIAAGSWASTVDVDGLPRSPIDPVKGQLLRLRWRGAPIRRILWSSLCYIVPQSDGTLLVGATMEHAGFDDRPTAEGVRGLLAAAKVLLPASEHAEFLEARAGLRPASPDGLPVVGPSVHAEAVFYALGHFRNGVMLAPLTAALVEDAVLGEGRDPALALLAPARFGL